SGTQACTGSTTVTRRGRGPSGRGSGEAVAGASGRVFACKGWLVADAFPAFGTEQPPWVRGGYEKSISYRRTLCNCRFLVPRDWAILTGVGASCMMAAAAEFPVVRFTEQGEYGTQALCPDPVARSLVARALCPVGRAGRLADQPQHRADL